AAPHGPRARTGRLPPIPAGTRQRRPARGLRLHAGQDLGRGVRGLPRNPPGRGPALRPPPGIRPARRAAAPAPRPPPPTLPHRSPVTNCGLPRRVATGEPTPRTPHPAAPNCSPVTNCGLPRRVATGEPTPNCSPVTNTAPD